MRLALAPALMLALAASTSAADVLTVTNFDDVPSAAFVAPGVVIDPAALGMSGAFDFNGNAFSNTNYPSGYWEGWAISNQDAPLAVSDPDAYYINQSFAAAGGAASGNNYAVAYSSLYPAFPSLATIDLAAGQKAYSIDLTNTWYAEQLIRNGNNYGDPFGAGDYFTLTINGYAGGVLTGFVEIVLADYRNGQSFVRDTWETFSLLGLGDATTLEFSFFSTDTDAVYGPRTPTYVAVDNFTTYAPATAVPEPSSWALMALGSFVAVAARRRRLA